MSYQQGCEDGYQDGQTLQQPPNTGGHTRAAIQRICAKYRDAIYSFAATDYDRGYGDGLDKAAIEAGMVGEELEYWTEYGREKLASTGGGGDSHSTTADSRPPTVESDNTEEP